MNLACSARLETTDLASVSINCASCCVTVHVRYCIFVYALQEGPHIALNEDEFFDALEMAYQQDEMVWHYLSLYSY